MAAAGNGDETIVGRRPELAVFDGLLADLDAGRGRCALIEGEPGSGKTTVLDAVLRRAGGAGLSVARGACAETARTSPLSVLFAALALAGPPPGDVEAAAVEHLLAEVARRCADRPLVLSVDGLQWADEASRLVWQRLARTVSQAPLLLVGTCRPIPRTEGADRLRQAVRANGGVLVPLEPLSPPEVSELAGRLTGRAPGPRLASWLELAGGNPSCVREMLVAAADDPDDDLRSMAGVVADRLDFLGTATREVLDTAALLGADFSVTEISAVLGRSAVSLAGAVQEAITAGVLESAGMRLRFRHGLLRQALCEAVPEPARTARRREIVLALIASGAPLERTAELILGALDAADSRVVDWIAENAEGLGQRIPEVAVDLVEHALARSEVGSPRHAALLDRLAAVSFLVARYERTVQVCQEISAGSGDSERRGRAAWFAGCALGDAGRFEEAAERLGAGLADPGVSEVWRARLTAAEAMNMLRSGRMAMAVEHAVAAGRRLADPMATAHALHARATARFLSGDAAGCLEAADEALAAVGTDARLSDVRMRLLALRISALSELDRFAEADDVARTARALGPRVGTRRMEAMAMHTAQSLYRHGRWDAALTESAKEPGIMALIAGHRDDRRAAKTHLASMSADGDVIADPVLARSGVTYAVQARSLAAEQAAEPERAAAILKAVLEPEYTGVRLWPLPTLVRLSLDIGDAATARHATEAATESGPQAAAAEAVADWCRGLLEGDAERVSAAADRFRAGGRRLELGNALEDAAVLRAAAGRSESAREALAEALAVYAELGAAWDAKRAASRMRPHGIRPGALRPRVGRDALTETELRVAELVARGKSNPDIADRLVLSRNTVETHVKHILSKLQARSRREVADLLRSEDSPVGSG